MRLGLGLYLQVVTRARKGELRRVRMCVDKPRAQEAAGRQQPECAAASELHVGPVAQAHLRNKELDVTAM